MAQHQHDFCKKSFFMGAAPRFCVAALFCGQCYVRVDLKLDELEGQMKGLAFYFLLVGVLSVLVGMVWGIQMSATQDHGLSPAHGHLNLIGWVSMTLFALYYHVVPGAAQSRLAMIHFAVSVVGLIVLVPGIAIVLSGGTESLAKIGSMITVAAMLLFLAVVLRNRAA